MYKQNPPRIWLHFCLILTFSSSCISSSYPQQTSPTLPTHSHGYPLNVDDHQPHGFEERMNTKSSRRRSHHDHVRAMIVNVDKFGAKGDGRSDDTRAFGKAWNAACSSRRPTQFVVPKNKVYVLKPIGFSGPCRANLIVKIFGTIKGPRKIEDYKKNETHWIRFERLENLKVKGGGTIDGNGKFWWQNSCKVKKSLLCVFGMQAVTFHECNNLVVSNLRFKNSQRMHLSFDNCLNVRASHLLVTAPWDSPNTDGIHVTATRNIQITKSLIKTGDDCISIVSGSKYVKATDITCGPGHGISIGSLGAGNATAEVSEVFVSRATISGTSNGVRIKTWQGGSGYARNIKFEHIMMKNVSNPIIIDQNYCDQTKPCEPQVSAVRVSNVMYKNIKGTSASKLAIKFECSKNVPCEEIVMQDVSLMASQDDANDAKAECVSVDLTRKGRVTPLCYSN
ncbi:unnamed protein product [Linum perenne]